METTAKMPKPLLEGLVERTRKDDDIVLPLVQRRPSRRVPVGGDLAEETAWSGPSRTRIWGVRVAALATLGLVLFLLFLAYGGAVRMALAG